MPIIDGVKYACESCIKGHRTSKCTHEDRQLSVVKKKGRPYSAAKAEAGVRAASTERSDTPPSPSSSTATPKGSSNGRELSPPAKRSRLSFSSGPPQPLAPDGSPLVYQAASFPAPLPQAQHWPLVAEHAFSPTAALPATHSPETMSLAGQFGAPNVPKSALFVPSTEGTSSCFCGDSCACPGCPLHDPLQLKQGFVRAQQNKPPCQCTVVEKMISGQDAQCCSHKQAYHADGCHSQHGGPALPQLAG